MVKNWNDITLRQFNQVKPLDLSDLSDQITAAEILLGINADDLTWIEFSRKVKELDFLDKPIPKTIVRKSYTINNRKYRCEINLQEFNVARFMDFTNMSKTNEYEKILGVILIPDGKEYGKYDMEQVYSDILDMSIVDVFAIFNFFKVQFVVCTKTMKDYSVQLMKKDKKLAKAISDIMDSFCMLEL